MQDQALRQFWNEEAALILDEPTSDSPRQLLREAKLWEILVYLDAVAPSDRVKLMITLPDRRVAPTILHADRIEALLSDPRRPAFIFPSPRKR